MVILTYCMAVPVPQVPVSPDSHKNLVNVSWLVMLYVMVLDRVYWHPDREASEWIGVLANVMKLNSLALLAHHPILWNHSKKCCQPARKARTFTVLFFSVHWCVDTYSAWVTTDLSFTDYLYYCSNGKLSIWRIISLTQDPYARHLHHGWFDLIQEKKKNIHSIFASIRSYLSETLIACSNEGIFMQIQNQFLFKQNYASIFITLYQFLMLWIMLQPIDVIYVYWYISHAFPNSVTKQSKKTI